MNNNKQSVLLMILKMSKIKVSDTATLMNLKVSKFPDHWKILIFNAKYKLIWKNFPEANSFDDLRAKFLELNPDWIEPPGGGTIIAFCHYLSTCDELPDEVDVERIRLDLIESSVHLKLLTPLEFKDRVKQARQRMEGDGKIDY